MKITFCGAAGGVTGSCYLMDDGQYRFIIDCGMFQGGKEIRQLNRQGFLFSPTEIDFVLLTHAHVDHSGLLPKLVKEGFKGEIFTSKATVDLCGIILRDSGHIQESEAEWRGRKNPRSGDRALEPLYTIADAEACLQHFKACHYNESFEPRPGLKVTYRDAGHILGSAVIELEFDDAGKKRKIVFSGDLGQSAQPIINDPTLIDTADFLLIESTYGDRIHQDRANRVNILRDIILEAVASGGNLIIPAFTVGRTQDLLYYIRTLMIEGKIPQVQVYIDSPMAISVTEIYENNPDYYDEPTRELFRNKQNPFEFPGLHFTRSTEESKQINLEAKGAIIISANGMCEAGRILHHLKHNLWRPESHILFAGYQAKETLGWWLLNGAKNVKIMGEVVTVNAKIHKIDGFSAHADQGELLAWLGGFQQKPASLFIIHGEPETQQAFAALIQQKFGIQSTIPAFGATYQLTDALQPITSAKEIITPQIELEKKVTDLEHLLLNLGKEIRGKAMDKASSSIQNVKKLVAQVEERLTKENRESK